MARRADLLLNSGYILGNRTRLAGCVPARAERHKMKRSKIIVATLVFLSLLTMIRPENCTGQGSDVRLANAAERMDWAEVDLLLKAKDVDINLPQADGMTALHWAVHSENVTLVLSLLNRRADHDTRTAYEITPLVIACQNGNEAIARKLLEAGADPNRKRPGNETPLMTAARAGHRGVLQALIESGAKLDAKDRRGQTALMWASDAGNEEAVDVLISAGADVQIKLGSGFSAMMFAARRGKSEIALRLIAAGVDVNEAMAPKRTGGRKPRKGMSALMLAVESGHFETAMKLIDVGADPNDQRSGFAPLHAVSWVRKTKVGDDPDGDPPPVGSGNLNSIEFVKRLIKAGANVNLKTRRGSGGKAKLNTRGATPFLLAARGADLPLMHVLLAEGADPKVANYDGCTSLMAAAGIGVIAVGEHPGSEEEVEQAIRLLVRLGVDINAVDKNGETAMHGAAYRNYPTTVGLLASLGADPEVWNNVNEYGWTPSMIAAGKRPGSFKPSPETIAALETAARAVLAD